MRLLKAVATSTAPNILPDSGFLTTGITAGTTDNEVGIATNATETHHIPALKVKVVDTTGAGDAACGAFLYATTHGETLNQSAHYANAMGALIVQGKRNVSITELKSFMSDTM